MRCSIQPSIHANPAEIDAMLDSAFDTRESVEDAR